MRTPISLSIIGLVILSIIGSSTYALPSTPPAGSSGYTGGIFAHYFQNIIEGNSLVGWTSSGGTCPSGKAITGYSMLADGTYGLPICGTVTSPQYWSSADAGANIYFTGAGNVAIGKETAGALLDVDGDILVNGLTIGRGEGNVATNTTNGYLALYSNTNGGANTAIGSNTLFYNTSGGYNTAIGYAALNSNSIGIGNTANGVQSLYNTTGGFNTANGVYSLYSNITGVNNVAIGYNAGYNLISGDNNIAIGASTNFVSTTASNQLNIGNWIYGQGGNIGIGTGTALTAKLTVAGTVQITGGAPGAGKVLTSDASGVASWTTPSSNGWELTGNTGTTAGTNYVGTTDNNDLVFKANNIEKLRITATGSNLVGGGYSTTIGGTSQVALGNGAGYNMLGTQNTAVGGSNPGSSMSGTQNTGIGGVNAGYSMVGSQNTGIGGSSPGSSMAGTKNTAIGGMNTGYNGYGTENTAVGGVWAGHSMAGTRNTAVGGNAAGYNMLGSNNVAIGTYAGKDMYNINDSVFIGSYAAGNIGQDNQFSLGNVIYGSGMGAAGATNGKVGIGTSTLTSTAKLEIAGTIKITGGTPGTGKVLTSDATGLASWETPSGGAISGGQTNYGARWLTDTTLGTGSIFDNGANVGIGTTSPTAKLEVAGQISGGFGAQTTAGVLDWNDITNARSGNGYTILLGSATNGPAVAGGMYYHPFSFEYSSKNGAGNMTQLAVPYNDGAMNAGMYMRSRYSGTWSNWTRILSENTSGNVGIGTTAPAAKLHVAGNMQVGPFYFDGNDDTWLRLRVSDGGAYKDLAVGNLYASINSYATAFLYNSDRRLKENIIPLSNALDKIISLNGYSFDWKSTKRSDIGVIAQEVEGVFPELVQINPVSGMKSVEYGNLVAPIIEAIKELANNMKSNTREIEALKSENAELKKRLDAIEARLAK